MEVLTYQKSLIKNRLFGSKNENRARTLLETIIHDYFDKSQYDIIIGINTRNIISPKEIDIPVIIIDLHNNKFYKVAIEYNGVGFHKQEKDTEKENVLRQNGWIYMPILEFGNSRVQKEYGDVENQLIETCKIIKDYIEKT